MSARMMPNEKLYYLKMESPIGPLFLVSDHDSLRAVIFESGWQNYRRLRTLNDDADIDVLRNAETQLREYFAGQRQDFDLPLKLEGTEFQKNVWTALKRIPYGKTATYKDQATNVGRPKATRAVGATNGMNPLSIVLPCHRVIGSSGKLTGYAGGLDKKEFLLKLEGARA